MPVERPPPPATADLQRLLALRLGRRGALQRALLEAVFGCTDCAALDARQRRRLQALLEQRDDDQLSALAWRGDAGRSVLRLQLDLLLDGAATADETAQVRMALLALLCRQDWLPAVLAVRSVLVSDADG